MNDKLLNFAMLIFFASILGNGALLMLANTPSGTWILGDTTSESLTTTLTYQDLNGFNVKTNDGFIANSNQSQDSSSFNPFVIIGNFLGQAVNTVFAGINAMNFIIVGLFAMESIFFRMSGWFPIFSPILLGLAAILLGVKFLLIGYFGSVLLKTVLGGKWLYMDKKINIKNFTNKVIFVTLENTVGVF